MTKLDRGRRSRAALFRGLVLALGFIIFAAPARANEPPPVDVVEPFSPHDGASPVALEAGRPVLADGLEVTVSPVFGEASFVSGFWSEAVVVLTNRGQQARRGAVSVGVNPELPSRGVTGSRVTFEAAAGARVELVVPFLTSPGDAGCFVDLRDEAGKIVLSGRLEAAAPNKVFWVEVGESSALRGHLHEQLLAVPGDPWNFALSRRAGFGAFAVSVGQPLEAAGAATLKSRGNGEPILPRRAASYARTAVVLLASDVLTRLEPVQLSALTGWVLSGGSLAIYVTRPEDLRHPTLASLLGGEARTGPVSDETRALVATPPMPSGNPPYPTDEFSDVTPPSKKALEDIPLPNDIEPLLSGFEGGNLHPSGFGATATYGLGEVTLLPLDPTKRPAVDSPWVHVRLLSLMRRSVSRLHGRVSAIGIAPLENPRVREYLDPNEVSGGTFGLTILLLCVFAVVAGPVNFAYWRRRGAPLRSIPTLLVLSAATFVTIVGVAVITKGFVGRARHLTFVEAGAGARLGSAQRFRAFFVPSARTLQVAAEQATSVIAAAPLEREGRLDSWSLQRDAFRVEGVTFRPWETRVVVEEALVSLGDGITLTRGADGGTEVINRTGRALVGLILSDPSKGTHFLARLDEGQRADLRAFTPRSFASKTSSGVVKLTKFEAESSAEFLDAELSRLGSAWVAIDDASGGLVDWFPDGVPTLLAQVEGGEGVLTDSGLRIEHDRTLVRIVGYGGEP